MVYFYVDCLFLIPEKRKNNITHITVLKKNHRQSQKFKEALVMFFIKKMLR